MEIIHPNVGYKILDHSTNTEVEISRRNAKDYIYGIYKIDKSTKSVSEGFFSKNFSKNILVILNKTDSPRFAISKEIFGDLIYFNNVRGFYCIRQKDQDIKGDINLLKGSGDFPYSIMRNYDAQSSMKVFNSVNPGLKERFDDKYKSLLKYTFGIEYETSCGYIPQEECFRSGLIPLRDGSISGIEYASVVMDSKFGIERVFNQIELLNQYTSFDKNCSLHIHYGGFPISSNAIMALYVISTFIQNDIAEYLPTYSFSTRNYKASGKDYCKLLPVDFSDFGKLYTFVSDNKAAFAGSLTERHPSDPNKEAKWQVKSRYHWLNLTNMCFYGSPKTIEVRMLRPTHNPYKLVFWIYFFNAMLLFAEKMSTLLNDSRNPLIVIAKQYIGIEEMLLQVYPTELCHKMFEVLDQLKYTVQCQSSAQDYIGELTKFEDSVVKTNLLNER